MIRVEAQTVIASITCLVTLWTTNSWSISWTWHFLSVNTTIKIWEICEACEWSPAIKSACILALFDMTDHQRWHSDKACSFCSLRPHAKYSPRRSWPNEWPRDGCLTKCHQACDWSSNCLNLIVDHLSCVRELIWALFQSWVLVTETVHCSQPEMFAPALALNSLGNKRFEVY